MKGVRISLASISRDEGGKDFILSLGINQLKFKGGKDFILSLEINQLKFKGGKDFIGLYL